MNRVPEAFFVYDCINCFVYEKLFFDICCNNTDSYSHNEIINHSLICAVFAILLADIINEKRHTSETQANEKKLFFIQDCNLYIDKCIQDSIDIDINWLAKKFSISNEYFLKRFASVYGKSYKQYIYEQEMIYAAFLLTTTDMKVKQIAEFLRYSDQYIFANMFKIFYSVSPSRFMQYYTV